MFETTMTDTVLGHEAGGDYWAHARREYLSGVKATTVCQKYGISLSSFRVHARAGRWRRMDQPSCDVPPEPGEYHREDAVSFANLADEAFLNIRRALGAGRAGEAGSWMRLYDRLADRARAEVMSELPDVPPPPDPSRDAGPLLFLPTGGITDNNYSDMVGPSVESDQEIDSLDSVFSESNPDCPATPAGSAASGGAEAPIAASAPTGSEIPASPIHADAISTDAGTQPSSTDLDLAISALDARLADMQSANLDGKDIDSSDLNDLFNEAHQILHSMDSVFSESIPVADATPSAIEPPPLMKAPTDPEPAPPPFDRAHTLRLREWRLIWAWASPIWTPFWPPTRSAPTP